MHPLASSFVIDRDSNRLAMVRNGAAQPTFEGVPARAAWGQQHHELLAADRPGQGRKPPRN